MNTDQQNVVFYGILVFLFVLIYSILTGTFNNNSSDTNTHWECSDLEKRQAFMTECIKRSTPSECVNASISTYCVSVKNKFDIEEIVTDKIREWVK